MEAAKVSIVVDANSNAVGPGLASGVNAVTSFERVVSASMQKVSTAFGTLSKAQIGLGALALGAGLVGTALVATIGPAIEFESAFAGVRKTVDGTPAQLEAIRSGLLDMSRIMPTSAADLASIAENAGQLGVQAPFVLEFTRVIAQLGETTDLSFDEAAQSLARFLNITGSGAGGITSVADSIVNLGNNSATTESQIVNFATRLASALTIAGSSEEQILGLAAGFSSLGLRAEAGGSALSRIFTSISDAARTGGTDLQTYADTAGLLPDEFARIARTNPAEAFFLFADGLAEVNAEGGSFTPTLNALELGGLRTSEVFRLAALNTDFLRNSTFNLSDSLTNAGAAQEEYNKRIETTASRIEIFRGRLNALAIAAGTPLLDSFAVSVDLAGDAIERIADLLGPLSTALGDTFSNAAVLVRAFFEVLGGPALAAAVAGFNGLLVVTTALLEAFNGLGPAGLVIAALIADILLVGPASVAAASGMAAFGAATTTATAPLVIFRGAVAGLQTALAAGPLLLAVVAIASLGAAFIDAGNRAKEAGDKVRNDWQRAIEDTDYNALQNEIRGVRERMQELAAVDTVPDGIATSFDGWGQSIKSVGQILTPFTENTILNARRELEELQDVANDSGFDGLSRGVALAAESLGLSKDSVIELGVQLGVMDELVDGTAAGFGRFFEAVSEASAAQLELADRTGISIDKIVQGEATLGDYATALGITVSQIDVLTNKLDEVDTDDLLDPAKADLAEGAIRALVDAYDVVAEQIGTTTSELLEQEAAALQVAAAHNELQQAVQGAADAMKAVEQQQRITTEASAAFDEALTTIGENDGIQLAAESLQTYLLNLAGSGVDFAKFEDGQAKAISSFIDAASAAGKSADEIADYVLEFGAIPEGVVTDLILRGAEAEEASRQYREEQKRILTEILTTLDVEDDEARRKIIALIAELDEFDTGRTVTLSAQGFDSLDLIPSTLAELEEFERGRDAELSATDAGAGATIEDLNGDLGRFDLGANAELSVTDGASPTIRESVALADGFERRFAATLLAEDEATGTIRGAAIEGAGFATTYPSILEALDSATPIIDSVTGELLGMVANPYEAELTADNGAAFAGADEAEARLQSYALGPYDAPLTASDNATPTITTAEQTAQRYAQSGYDAQLTASDSAAQAVILGASAAAVGYAIARYQATLTTDNAAALIRIGATAGAALSYATSYRSTLNATDFASAVIRRAVGALSGFRSKSITLTTYRRTVTSSGGGNTYFADGGFSDGTGGALEIPRGATRSTPGRAKIYPATTEGRYFDEPETGGEAYIPMGLNKRDQALPVFMQVGREFGIFNNGGLVQAASSSNRVAALAQVSGRSAGGDIYEINAPVVVQVEAAPGMSEERVADLVGGRIRSAFEEVGRDLANIRRR